MRFERDGLGSEWTESRLGRRAALRGGLIGASGLAAAALMGCGGDDEGDDAPSGEVTAAASGTSAASTDPRYRKDPNLPYAYNFPEPEGKTPKAGGTLRVAASWDVATMDPTKSAAGGTITIPNMVYNRLLGMVGGPDVNPLRLELEPELAASWERTPDGMTYTFQIKPGTKWQNVAPLNGRPFVAEDAKFAYERYRTSGVHQSLWVNVASLEAVSDTTLKINMKRPVADFLNPLGGRYQTIFPRELVDNGSIERTAVGTSAMILKSATAGSSAVFEKNPDYFERPVLLDGFEFKIVPDQAARLAAFRAGQVEYAYAVANSIDDVNNLLGTNPQIQINMVAPSYGGIPFGMNLSHAKFQDERVRRAIQLAIDTNMMTTVVWKGLGKTLPPMPWAFMFDEEPTPESGVLGKWWRFAPAESKQLLQAAGAEGLSLTNQYYAYGDYLDRYAELLVPMFRDVGIAMSGGKVDYTEFNSQWVGAQLKEVTTSGWVTVGFDADNFFYNIVHSKSPGNRWRMNDAQVDKLAEQQQVELNVEARKAIHRQMWDHILDMAYWPPMPSQIVFEIYQPWLRGIRFGGALGANSSYYDWGDQAAEAWLDK
ncbi:MAG: ABC transporter substrate-binding protein [Dehalococcoidia bacterium]